MWSKEDEVVKSWIKENRYTSHQTVNELMEIIGNTVLHNLLKKMTNVTGPAWFAIIADEATDVVNTLTIHWVSTFVKTPLDCVEFQIQGQTHCSQLSRTFSFDAIFH